jgi:hypothetical protein
LATITVRPPTEARKASGNAVMSEQRHALAPRPRG